MAKYTSYPDCFDAARAAAGGGGSAGDTVVVLLRLAEDRERLRAEGDITNMGDQLRNFARREAERAQLSAAMLKRHAGRSIVVRGRQEQAIDGLMGAGLTAKEA